MIRPFGLRNTLHLHSLTRQSTLLQVERAFLHPQAPLAVAIGAPLPWHGSGAATYLWQPRQRADAPAGFVQAIKRRGRPEADLTHIAPALNAQPHRAETWRLLLAHLIQSAADHGIQRLYTCLPSTDTSTLEAVTAAGFAPYIQETLFILSAAPAATASAWPHVRPQTEVDAVAVPRLLGRCTPPLVQQAEGLLVAEGETPSRLDWPWWQPEPAEVFVYEAQGEVVAAVQVRRGQHGHWLRLIGDPAMALSTPQVLRELLACGLDALSRGRARPIFCPLRPYQSSFGPILREQGFQPDATLTRLVKHTTSFVRRPAFSSLAERIENALPGLAPTESRRTQVEGSQSPIPKPHSPIHATSHH